MAQGLRISVSTSEFYSCCSTCCSRWQCCIIRIDHPDKITGDLTAAKAQGKLILVVAAGWKLLVSKNGNWKPQLKNLDFNHSADIFFINANPLTTAARNHPAPLSVSQSNCPFVKFWRQWSIEMNHLKGRLTMTNLNPANLDLCPKCGISLWGAQCRKKIQKPPLPFFEQKIRSFLSVIPLLLETSLSLLQALANSVFQPLCKCSGISQSRIHLWDEACQYWYFLLFGSEHFKT